MIARLRSARRGPLAVAGILAAPLFFVGLMAFALLLDEPTVHVNARGVDVLGDPSSGTVAKIYVCAFAVAGAVVLVGVFAMLLPWRVAGIAAVTLTAIAIAVALLLPLDTWSGEHTARYPLGVDLVPRRSPSDLILRGEWEENAKRTAEQIGGWTIAIAVAALLITIALDVRRRRGVHSPLVPPPPQISTGDADITPTFRTGPGRP